MADPLEGLTAFGRALRDAGLPIGTGRIASFCRAAALLEPDGLYWAGRATLVARRDDIAVYDRVFRALSRVRLVMPERRTRSARPQGRPRPAPHAPPVLPNRRRAARPRLARAPAPAPSARAPARRLWLDGALLAGIPFVRARCAPRRSALGGLLLRHAAVVVCSDGLDVGDPKLLGEQMARLSRLAHRIIWLNPLRESPEYEPLALGMAAALPYVDVFASGHNLAALEDLGAEFVSRC